MSFLGQTSFHLLQCVIIHLVLDLPYSARRLHQRKDHMSVLFTIAHTGPWRNSENCLMNGRRWGFICRKEFQIHFLTHGTLFNQVNRTLGITSTLFVLNYWARHGGNDIVAINVSGNKA